jgi:hypothetical protein
MDPLAYFSKLIGITARVGGALALCALAVYSMERELSG